MTTITSLVAQVATDESEESDTQIDTDSEFGDVEFRSPDCKIPTIVIDEDAATSTPHQQQPHYQQQQQEKRAQKLQEHKHHNKQKVFEEEQMQQRKKHNALERVTKETSPTGGAEKSASLTSLADLTRAVSNSVSPADRLRAQLLLNRTESNEALTSQKNLLLRRQYLLGHGSSLPKKSVSTADLGNKFKSFMEKISETQKMLHPAPQPSPAMQAYINKTSPGPVSPLSPLTSLKTDLSNTKTPEAKDLTNNASVNDNEPTNKASESSIESVIVRDSTSNNNNIIVTSTPCDTGNVADDVIIISDDSDDEAVKQLDFGEQTKDEGNTLGLESASNHILNDLSDNSCDFDTNVNPIGVLLDNTEDAVETINEGLLWGTNQQAIADSSIEVIDVDSSIEVLDHSNTMASNNHVDSNIKLIPKDSKINENTVNDTAGNVSLQSIKSVPSDVDELFEMLAKDAQSEEASFLSFTSDRNQSDICYEQNQDSDIDRSQELNSQYFNHLSDREKNTDTLDKISQVEQGPNASSKNPSIPICEINLIKSADTVTDTVTPPISASVSLSSSVTSTKPHSLAPSMVKVVPRMASVESLGDTESLSAAGVCTGGARGKGDTPQPPSVPPPLLEETIENTLTDAKEATPSKALFETDTIDFMDSNEEELSEQRPHQENNSAPSRAIENINIKSHQNTYKKYSTASNKILTRSSPPTTIKLTKNLPLLGCKSSSSIEKLIQPITSTTVTSKSPSLINDENQLKIFPTESIEISKKNENSILGKEDLLSNSNNNLNGSNGTVPSTPSKESANSDFSHQKIVNRTVDSGGGEHERVPSPAEGVYTQLNVSSSDTSPVPDARPTSLSLRSDLARKRTLLQQGSSSATSSELTETEESSSLSSSSKASELNSKENSSFSSSSVLNGRKFSGSDGSKEALLSSPELVKNITYNSPVTSPTKNIAANIKFSSPPQTTEPKSLTNYKMERSSSASNATAKRYEGYIPRFKDHRAPFSYKRESLDKKENLTASSPSSSAKTVTVVPSSASNAKDVSISPKCNLTDDTPLLRKMEKNVLNTKKKDGDVVQQLVLSRIARKTTERSNRRGSRTTLSPLSSKENLLDGSVTSITGSNDDPRGASIQNAIGSVSAREQSLEKSTCSLSERTLFDPKGVGYTPKFSPYSPVDIRPGRSRANTIGTITRDSKAMSLCNLPATPLTHPDQFTNLGKGPKQLFKSSISAESKDVTTSSINKNILIENPVTESIIRKVDSTPMSAVISGLDLERSQARERARGIAQKKSDFDLGLSPPHIPPAIICRMKRDSESEPVCNIDTGAISSREEQLATMSTRRDPAVSSSVPLSDAGAPRELAVLSDRNKEERVRMLLAEQRSRDLEAKHDRGDRDEKIAEKLQEFRVKKDKKAAVLTNKQEEISDDSENKFVRKKSSRPSLLELESMQVFSKPTSVAAVVNLNSYNALPFDTATTQQPCHTAPMERPHLINSARGSYREAQLHSPPSVTHSSPPPLTDLSPLDIAPPPSSVITPPLSTSTPVTPNPAPLLTPSQISASKAATNPHAKPASERKHKSKDRERRRSLIQVFAGETSPIAWYPRHLQCIMDRPLYFNLSELYTLNKNRLNYRILIIRPLY